MSYDHWKATNPADEFLGPLPPEKDEEFNDYIARLEENAVTKEDLAKIDAVIAAYEAENGPRHDWTVWANAETPFADNH